jgi:crotonobetainyl-CoA:carnitine CoA-transferase CaiB-like acyl-CoA transferase
MDKLFAPHMPLNGVRVLDITVVWAGPHCTQLLAEWGAEVIRIEPLQVIQPSTRGAEGLVTKEQVERARGSGNQFLKFPNNEPEPRQWNRSPAFNSHARNKRSMTVNVATPEGREVFLKMVAIADVVVENNVPETVERAGFTYADMAVANPRIIVLRMPSYGLNGPFKNYRSFGTHMEGMTGHHYLRSYPNLDPSMTGDAFTVDAASGVMGAFAVAMALRHRRRTGEGQHIEMAQAENFLGYLGEYILDYSMNGRSPEPQGNHHPSMSPHGAYPCRGKREAGSGERDDGSEGAGLVTADWADNDRWITIAVATDAEWRALCEVMRRPPWSADERFATTLGRWTHRDELDTLLAGWTRTQDDFELFHKLQAAGVPSGPVQNERDAYNCPQLQARGFFQEIDHPEFGTYSYPGFNITMAHTPNHVRRHPCLLGEDNDYVYHDLLDVSEEQYRELDEKGHIGMDYPPTAWGQGRD